MRYHSHCWPWKYAYATAQTNHRHESRWHQGRSSASFGVRRPLRYLSHKLDLDETQTRKMARVLNQLKTEREQAQLDEKRTIGNMAQLLEEGTPTLDEMRTVLQTRVKSAEHLAEETAKAVIAVSDFLDEDQRDEFINMLLTGAVSF